MSAVLHWSLLSGWSCDCSICRCHNLPLRADSSILPSELPSKQESALTSAVHSYPLIISISGH